MGILSLGYGYLCISQKRFKKWNLSVIVFNIVLLAFPAAVAVAV